MKCPICGQELRPSKKDPNYFLCYECKKKFKVPQKKTEKPEKAEKKVRRASAEEEQSYSNIPPKHVRNKRETEMRKAYDEMLAVEEAKRGKKKKTRKREEIDDDFFDDLEEEEEKMSKAPIIVLAIAIVVVAALIGYMLFFR